MVNKNPDSPVFLAWVALGSNLEIPLDELKQIPQLLVEKIHPQKAQIESVSQYYQTPAFPKGSGPDFINAVFCLATQLSPEALLKALHDMENAFDRTRPYRWAPRTLDLDLVFYDGLILPNLKTWQEWAGLSTEDAQKAAPQELILPHPRAHERAFVLGPLMDIAPEFPHPALNQTIENLWQRLSEHDRHSLTKLEDGR